MQLHPPLSLLVVSVIALRELKPGTRVVSHEFDRKTRRKPLASDMDKPIRAFKLRKLFNSELI